METKTKYYTPKIEELHVGFQCEYLSYRYNDPVWIDYIIGKSDMQDAFDKVLELDLFKVKYLNKEDIKSIGKYQTIFILNEFELIFWPNSENDNHNTNVYIKPSSGFDGQTFFGYIKNKSKLIDIMENAKN